MRYALVVLALFASACGVPTAPTVPDWRIATGAGAAPKGSTLPPPGEFARVEDGKLVPVTNPTTLTPKETD